ncbi:MAG: hypothetical protein AB1461_18500 [Thermodesulfobacteriota bacterium]
MTAAGLTKKIWISSFLLIFFPLQAGAAVISFSGRLDAITWDSSVGVYSGVPRGTIFSGFIDDETASGQISDGVTLTVFDSHVAAGGLTVSDNFILEEEDAVLLNTLTGTSLYTEGDILDGINIEGDAGMDGGGRIEIGLSYLFAPDTFADDNPANYPFDPAELQLALFFIFEEDASGAEVYHGAGRLDAVPLPPAGLLLGAGLAGVLGVARRKILSR